jgi:hypothetical protein
VSKADIRRSFNLLRRTDGLGDGAGDRTYAVLVCANHLCSICQTLYPVLSVGPWGVCVDADATRPPKELDASS